MMILRVLAFFGVLMGVPFMGGCTTSGRPAADEPIVASWEAGAFRVFFRAGPRGEGGRAFSYYRIEYKGGDFEGRQIVMESAHSTGGFESCTEGDPREWIRVIEDPGRDALLIEEEIPNECGPCSNYLWVRAERGGVMTGTYLRLPWYSSGGGGIDYEYPSVRAIEGDVILYGYSHGGAVRRSIDEIETADFPMPPG